MQSLCVTIQMKAIEKNFRALLLLTLYKLIATLKTAIICNFVKHIVFAFGRSSGFLSQGKLTTCKKHSFLYRVTVTRYIMIWPVELRVSKSKSECMGFLGITLWSAKSVRSRGVCDAKLDFLCVL